ncbi:MAG: hypothetical protein ACN4GW_06200 [Desulforhopalus sp.]
MTRFVKSMGALIGILTLLLLTACSSKQPVNFKIHTEPEGAHIIYSVDDAQWTYIGVTPVNAVEIIAEKQLEDGQTFTLKAMRCGYLDQSKEWVGGDLLEEIKDKGMIFWTPRLIRSSE